MQMPMMSGSAFSSPAAPSSTMTIPRQFPHDQRPLSVREVMNGGVMFRLRSSPSSSLNEMPWNALSGSCGCSFSLRRPWLKVLSR